MDPTFHFSCICIYYTYIYIIIYIYIQEELLFTVVKNKEIIITSCLDLVNSFGESIFECKTYYQLPHGEGNEGGVSVFEIY